MDILSSECVYEILLYSNPKEILLCSCINNIFNDLCHLESLWRNQNSSKDKDIFNKNSYYETCKLYCLLVKLKNKCVCEYLHNCLYLDDNNLTRIPDEVFKFVDLEGLMIQKNNIEILPPEIGQLINLKVLRLDNNNLTLLPHEIGKLTKLEDLWLDHNQLISLPPEIGQLISLKEFSCNENKLTHLPQEITNLITLKTMWINGTKIKEIPKFSSSTYVSY